MMLLNLKKIKIFINHIFNWYLSSKNNEVIKKEFQDLFNQNENKAREIILDNVTKVYPNGIKAIDNLSFNINPKEFIVLLGPSGCGKTTLLRMIAGLEGISDGYIKFDNTPINAVSAKDRELAMVFQNYALYPFMTVSKNISFGIKNKTRKNSVYKYKKKEIKIINNPLYDSIIKLRVKLRLLSRINNKVKDELLREKRVLSTLSKQKINNNLDAKKLEKSKQTKKELLKIINDFKKNKERLAEKIKIKKELRILKARNNKIRSKNIKDINKKTDVLFEEMLKSSKLWKDNIGNIVEKVTKMLGINMYTNRKPAELSGGQRQRVALARAISKETGIYLYDEPLSNLDAKLRANMRKEIRKIHNKMNATSIYVTHDQIEAMSMADRIVVMNKGYIQQIGTPKELMEKPFNLFVAKFIGNTGMNTFKAKHIKDNKFQIGKNKVVEVINSNLISKIKKFNKIILGIRPEHIITDPQLIGHIKINKFKGQIKEVEMLGNDVLLTIKNNEIEDIQMIVKLSMNIKLGDEIEFAFNQNKTYIYDEANGYNLLLEFNEANEKAKKIWLDGEIERKKNIFLMNKHKNKMSFTSYIRNTIIYPLSQKSRDKFKSRKTEIKYGNQKKAE